MINIEKLHFSYSKKKALFSDLDLELKPGKVYGLLGKNGTGKSSLLKLIVGAVFAKQGSCTVDGVDSSKRNPNILQDIFFLSENYETPAIKISEFVKANGSLYPKFDESKFYSFLEIFEIDSTANLEHLSYGQRKKVVISFAVATNVKYLLLDEPTNGLDIPSKSQFRKALLSGFQDDQIVIISTHQIRDLNQLIESIIIIEDGRILFHKDVFELEEKLLFTKSISDEDKDKVLYSEMVPGGYIHIQPNPDNTPSEVELEVLFNAIVQNKTSFNQYF